MRIMTTNIWGSYFNNPAEVRKDDMYKVYETYAPDIIGFQEVEPQWYACDMFRRLSDDYYIVGAQPFDSFNFVPMAIRKKYKVMAFGFERLTDVKDPSKEITWAVLQEDERLFAVCNTHFWWKTGPEHDRIREINAHQLCKLMKSLEERYGCPVFAFGDMNCNTASTVFTDIYPENGVVKLYDMAAEKDDVSSHHGDPVVDENGRFHGKKTDKDHTSSLDHIVGLGKGFEVSRYKIVQDQYALDATDHSPVYADISFL